MGGDESAMVPKEDEMGIELELGLSIGGSYARQNGLVLKPDAALDMDASEKNQTCTRSSVSPSCSAMQELGSMTKREIHALRRQEAKKKREEKLRNKYLTSSSQVNNGEIHVNNCRKDGTWLKAKDFQPSRTEIDPDERECKKIRVQAIGSNHTDVKKVNQNLSIDQNQANANNTAFWRPVPLHYGLPANGFVYPCANVNVVPYWFTGGAAFAEERNGVPVPAISYGFIPFQAGLDPGHNLGNGFDSEQNGSLDGGGNRKAGSSKGSPLCTSSTGSDHRSSSHEGVGSSYSRSHSSPYVSEQPQFNGTKADDSKGQSEHSGKSFFAESGPVNESTNQAEKLSHSKSDQSSPTGPKEESLLETQSDPTENHVSTPENTTSISLFESKEDMGKPPKPQLQNHITPLPYMPCVSTTGNGPNGKTINGFLYRYTKTEVSIICVCHGSSFSPAEFVQHAGGTDVSHPLRHITVIPSAF